MILSRTREAGSTCTTSGSSRSPVVGEKRVERDVVQARRAGHGMAGVRAAAALELVEDFFGIAEREVLQQDHAFLLPDVDVADRSHYQGRRQQTLRLETDVRVHPVGARAVDDEFVFETSAMLNESLRQMRSLEPARRGQPVPVQDGRFAELVFEPDREPAHLPRG